MKHAKPLFVLLCSISFGSLALAATNPLDRVQIYRRTIGKGFFQETETVIISEHSQYDWGFNPKKYKLIAEINHSYLFEKCSALIVAIISSAATMPLATRIMQYEQIEDIKAQGKIELETIRVNNKFAMARKSLQLMNQQELKELVTLVGGSEDQIADEINATDKFLNCSHLVGEGHSIDKAIEMNWGVKPGTDEHAHLKAEFEKWLDKDE